MKRYRIHVVDESALHASVEDLSGTKSLPRHLALIIALACFALAGVIYRCQEAQASPPTIEWETRKVQGAQVDYSSWVCRAPAVVEERHLPPSPFGLLILDPPTQEERHRVEVAISGCAWADPKIADPYVALALTRLEEEAGAPFGLLLAAWCRESSMRTQTKMGKMIRGDWHDGVPDSFGPFQLQRPFIAACGGNIDRADDPVWAGSCFLSRVLARLPEADCPEPWRVAEARVANAVKYLPYGCKAESQHWKIRKEWRL